MSVGTAGLRTQYRRFLDCVTEKVADVTSGGIGFAGTKLIVDSVAPSKSAEKIALAIHALASAIEACRDSFPELGIDSIEINFKKE